MKNIVIHKVLSRHHTKPSYRLRTEGGGYTDGTHTTVVNTFGLWSVGITEANYPVNRAGASVPQAMIFNYILPTSTLATGTLNVSWLTNAATIVPAGSDGVTNMIVITETVTGRVLFTTGALTLVPNPPAGPIGNNTATVAPGTAITVRVVPNLADPNWMFDRFGVILTFTTP